ncbi:MAG: gamma-glutamyl-gamma-aminobutyrate hydrolase family protein [Firmicutes bacterium]|nr:gamma-glutamyl-gamma-aminobutyrate hydrolase family protein [Bacillota bacterium]
MELTISNRPLIGIVPGYSYEGQKLYIDEGYVNAINTAGGLAILLSLTEDEGLMFEFVKRCDGFLIPGGPDLDAKHYNENNMVFNGKIVPIRDTMEIFIVRKAFEMGKPILGICRGIQVINVAMGGTLYQDINSQIKDRNILKHSQDAPSWYPIHDIFIEKDTIIYNSFKTGCIKVNSYHHQSVKDVASGFKATSYTADGIIESIEYRKAEFVVGVQWHPELMWQKNSIYLNIFKEFIMAARV